MRSVLLCATLGVAACAPKEQAGTAAGGGPGQNLVGTWEGRSYRDASDTGIPWRSIIARAPDGTIRGTLMFTDIVAGPVPIRVREVSGSKVVQELGPYHSPSVDRDVISKATGAMQGDSLTGSYEMRPAEGGDVIRTGTFRAKKVAS
jgi:hypothetical protein